MRTHRIIRLAVISALATGALAGGVFAQDTPDSDRNEAVEAAAPALVPTTPAAPIAPWYQAFTQGGNRLDLSGLPLASERSSVEIDAGSNWGVSLGFDRSSAPSARNESVDGLSAGAFFKVTPRMRVGGELGYRSQQSDPSGLRPNDEIGSSQVKLESAFRF